MTRAELIAVLVKIQNHPEFNHQDIMTFTGFMDDEEVKQHIAACQRRIAG